MHARAALRQFNATRVAQSDKKRDVDAYLDDLNAAGGL
jgi:hypothetical protein